MNMKDFPKVTKIEVKQEMHLHIEGECVNKTVDIGDRNLPGFYPDLKDPEYFKKAKLSGGSVEWPKGPQLDLYELVYDWPDVTAESI